MGNKASRGFERLSDEANSRILMVGLDGAGKTTVLNWIKCGEVLATTPTIGFNLETLEYKSMNFTVWDIGSQNNKIRPLWRHYFKGTHGLIFVVDSTDQERFHIAQTELAQLLAEKHLQNAAVLVLANKQDLPHAMAANEIAVRLGMHSLQNPWTVQPSSAVHGRGLFEGFDWLTAQFGKPPLAHDAGFKDLDAGANFHGPYGSCVKPLQRCAS